MSGKQYKPWYLATILHSAGSRLEYNHWNRRNPFEYLSMLLPFSAYSITGVCTYFCRDECILMCLKIIDTSVYIIGIYSIYRHTSRLVYVSPNIQSTLVCLIFGTQGYFVRKETHTSIHPSRHPSVHPYALSVCPIGLGKSGYQVNIFFLFLHENIRCRYSLEVPHWGTSNECPQHMFSWRNKNNIIYFGLKKKHLIKNYVVLS